MPHTSGQTPDICKAWEEQADVYADQPSFDPEFLNQQLSFPYPKNGPVIRSAGEGCRVCVHQTYCPALYWFRRYTQREPDQHNGIACESWSSDPADRPVELVEGTGNDFDNAENARRNCDLVLTEANRNGFTAATTGSNRCC